MATGAFVNAIVPKSFQVTVSTSPVRLKSSSSLATKFTVIATTQKVYIGDSSVSTTRGIPIALASSQTFDEFKKDGMLSADYDLAHWWAITTASISVTVINYVKQKDG